MLCPNSNKKSGFAGCITDNDLDIVRVITDSLCTAIMAGKLFPDIHHINNRIVARYRQDIPAGSSAITQIFDFYK
jgi:hypothetical protein